MKQDHGTTLEPGLPLLLRFRRPQPSYDFTFCYDDEQCVNLLTGDDHGLPVVATAYGRRALKTIKIINGED